MKLRGKLKIVELVQEGVGRKRRKEVPKVRKEFEHENLQELRQSKKRCWRGLDLKVLPPEKKRQMILVLLKKV
jgi:hypothetical protein